MSYHAARGLGLDTDCALRPGTSDVETNQKFDERRQYSCPARVTPYWFFPDSPEHMWWCKLLTSSAEEVSAKEAWAKSGGEQRTDWRGVACVPPFVTDYSTAGMVQAPSQTSTERPPTEGYPWRQYSSDTQALQQKLNTVLPKHGYASIGVDGKLGPGTCGAARRMKAKGESVAVPSTCQSYTEPSKLAARRSGIPTVPSYTPPGSDLKWLWWASGLSVAVLAGVAFWPGKAGTRPLFQKKG